MLHSAAVKVVELLMPITGQSKCFTHSEIDENDDSKVGKPRVGNKLASGLEYVCYQTRRAPMRPLLVAMLPDPKYELNT